MKSTRKPRKTGSEQWVPVRELYPPPELEPEPTNLEELADRIHTCFTFAYHALTDRIPEEAAKNDYARYRHIYTQLGGPNFPISNNWFDNLTELERQCRRWSVSITLGDFLEDYCDQKLGSVEADKTKKSLANSKLLPPHIEPYKSGQQKCWHLDVLLRAWPKLRAKMPSLPKIGKKKIPSDHSKSVSA